MTPLQILCKMKQYTTALLLFCTAVILLLPACERQYEQLPLEKITEADLWDTKDSNAVYANRYLGSIYSRLPSAKNRISGDFLDAATDDAVSSVEGAPVETMARGGITIFSNPDEAWNASYTGIRMCTNFLNNFGKVPLRNKIEKRAWFGEARVMRAFFYWELVKRYGGIPLLGDSLTDLRTNLQLPRNTFEECVAFIAGECNRAMDSLRADPADDNNTGRWTKAGAMALKARVLLYAASPLYNGQRIGTDLNGYASYDGNRWKQAADAAGQIMDLQVFSIEPDFTDVFISAKSTEVIYAKTEVRNTGIENINGPPGFSTAIGSGRTSPTQELVDAFLMRNLKSIKEPGSGYDPGDPYANRDRRFYSTIFYNNAPWAGSRLQLYNGGMNRPGGSSIQTRTGYYMKKLMGRFETQTQYTAQYHDNIYFRYGEVLLSYAEAMNEYAGPTPEVYDALDALLGRAFGDPEPGAPAFHLKRDMSREAMRLFIRNQRRAELVLEEHRYWDLRRWKIAAQVYNRPLHGVMIRRASDGTLSFTEHEVLTTAFNPDKDYCYPIPFIEMASNSRMIQNPGWTN